MSDMKVNQLLQQMRMMSLEAQAKEAPAAQQGSFAKSLGQALDSVNATQQESASMKKAFEMGDPTVSLVDTMVASQKASIAFQATLQVRNKFIQAYQDIMNMPI